MRDGSGDNCADVVYFAVMRARVSFWAICTSIFVAACTSPPSGDAGDAAPADGADASMDAPPGRIVDLPVQSRVQIAGLEHEVDVVIDRQGWPHIYARSLRDAMFVQGVLMARDRMPQMELLRRLSSGNLAQAFGGLSASVIESDLTMRTIGLRRAAQAAWDMMAPGRGRLALEAFSAGVTYAIDEVRSGARRTPSGTELVVNDGTPDWTPVDSLTIGRYQSFSLSYDADQDIATSRAYEAVTRLFDGADSMMQPEHARRAGVFWDLFVFAAPSNAQVVPGFYTMSGMGLTYQPRVFSPELPRGLYDDTHVFFERARAAASVLGLEDRGSNNWVVAASASSTGHALLANDPHLALSSPAVWWGSQLVVSEGADAIDVAGVTFPGIPGVVLGYNRNVAWGGTVADFDVTDVYLETVTPGAAGAPDTVTFMGRQVPIETITEQVPDGMGGMVAARIEVVPHHGPIVPTIRMGRIQPRTGTSAMSVRWTGHRPSRDFDAFLGLMYARNVADARRSLDEFGVGAQNWVIADTDGNIGYTTSSIVPERAAGARTWSPMNLRGTMPCMLLPGGGEAEWIGEIPRARLPNATGTPARPWIATANNDQAGLATDNNPFNDPVFLSCRWAAGFRAERIQQRLSMLARPTLDDMRAIQNDHVVLGAARMRPFVQGALNRLFEEWAMPGRHADLTTIATTLRPQEAQIRDALSRLMAWSLDAASGVDYDSTESAQRDSVAASIFHALAVSVSRATFDDELAVIGGGSGLTLVFSLFRMLEHPDQLAARDPATMQSVLWDDLTTSGVHETRDAIIARATGRALTELTRLFSTPDMTRWLWGNVHTVRFNSVVTGLGAALSIPPMGDRAFPNGFPRPGGFDVVDASEPGLNDYNFSFGSGASMRFSVDMDPAGPRGFNSIPGGQVFNTSSRHHRDLAELWRRNEVFAIPRLEREVVAAAEARLVFSRAP